MSNKLAEQLREMADKHWPAAKYIYEAADELERLSAENRKLLKEVAYMWGSTVEVVEEQFQYEAEQAAAQTRQEHAHFTIDGENCFECGAKRSEGRGS